FTVDTTGTIGSVTNNFDGTFDYDPNGQFDYLADGQSATDTFTYTVDDGHGGTSTAMVTVTIHGQNDTPMAVNDDASATEAGGVANGTPGSNPSGNVLSNDTDADFGDTKAVTEVNGSSGNVGTTVAGSYGSVTIDADGSYSYTVDNNNAA